MATPVVVEKLMSIGAQASGNGQVHYLHRPALHPYVKQAKRPPDLIEDHQYGHYRQSRRGLLLQNQPTGPTRQQKALTWLRDQIDPRIPRWWYQLMIGHDLHLSTFAALYIQHFHATERDPFTGELGWLENVGRVSQGKVTTAFRDFEIDQLIAESALYGDFKYHEVGLSATAESNTQSALVTTTGIARVAGTQVEAAVDIYRTVATVTADGSEVWQEHGIFNQPSAGTMLDRSLIVPVVNVVVSDTVTFTYELQKSAEP